MKTEHILIMRFSALGDVAMTVPVVYSLAKQYPDVRISVLSRPFAEPFFENLAPNVSFMGADVKDEYHGIKGLNSLFRRLAAKNFTAVADFHDVLRSKYLRLRFNLGGYKVQHINKHREGKNALVAEGENKNLIQQPTSFENYAEVLEKLGYPIKYDFTSIFPPEGGDLSKLPQQITAKGTRRWIGIAPFAAHKGKVYPIEKMEQVISKITYDHPSCRIFLFGGKGRECEAIDNIVAKHSECINASAMLRGLRNELILMSHLDVMVSMDSANMHLASLVNTPVVSIWGCTHPYAGFLGWGQKEENIVQMDMPCRPCSIFGTPKCLRGDFACMNDIRPEAIVSRIEAVLNN